MSILKPQLFEVDDIVIVKLTLKSLFRVIENVTVEEPGIVIFTFTIDTMHNVCEPEFWC